jgi:hypothetical protein
MPGRETGDRERPLAKRIEQTDTLIGDASCGKGVKSQTLGNHVSLDL